MTKKKDSLNLNGMSNEIGAPFDPFGTQKYPINSNARIMPSQFGFPNVPMNYMIIRNVDDNNDGMKN